MNPLTRVLAFALLGALVATPPVWAHSPSGQRVAAKLIDKNQAAGRTQTLSLHVSLLLGAQQTVVASGRLDTSPNGYARLELESPQGIVERHLSRRGVVTASRDGRPLDSPRPFLAPLPLLQLGSPIAYSDQLGGRSLTEPVALGYVGDHDCYVLGRKRGTSMWVDLETLDAVRLSAANGTAFELGPYQPFGQVLLPSWIESRDDGAFRARLVIDEVLPGGDVPPDGFETSWLYR